MVPHRPLSDDDNLHNVADIAPASPHAPVKRTIYRLPTVAPSDLDVAQHPERNVRPGRGRVHANAESAAPAPPPAVVDTTPPSLNRPKLVNAAVGGAPDTANSTVPALSMV